MASIRKRSTDSPAEASRVHYLDGLRGVAALTVVGYHYLLAYGSFAWKGFVPGYLTLLGDLPVCVFFVLSGFVLAESAARSRAGLARDILARYLRLTIPMTVSLILAWMWLRGFPHSRETIQASGIQSWLSTAFITHQPISLWHALSDGLAGVYLTGTSFYNCVVWTMKIEFFGSILIYLVSRLPLVSLRWLGWAGIGAFALHDPFYLGFALGGALRELRAARQIGESGWGWAALVASIAVMAPSTGRTPTAFALLSVSAALIVLSILITRPLQIALSARVAHFLGRISFSLYLVHAPLLVTVMAWYQLHAHRDADAKFMVGLATFTVFSLVLAWLMTRLIDEPLVDALRRWRQARW